MRARIIAVIVVGMTIGFLLALGGIASLRSALDGEDARLSIAFSVLVLVLAASLIWYVIKSTPD